MEERTDNARRIALRLELDPGAEPISGRLIGPDEICVDFIGWLALSAALERLTGGEEQRRAAGR